MSTNSIAYSNKTKWLILLGFSLLVGVNQLLWLTFATIVISTQEFYAVSEFQANLLTLIFPVTYVLFSIHSGNLLDKKGYKKVVSWFAIIMLLGSAIRYLGFKSYWLVFAGQFLIAVAQPYITNAINQIISDWFPKEQLNTATGLAIAGLFLSIAVGAFISPVLLESVGFDGMLLVNLIITAVIVGYFLLVIKEKDAIHIKEGLDLKSVTQLLKNKRLWLISFIVFIAIGYFNGLTNWMALIVEPNGINEEQTGIITAVLILGGIFGSIVIPLLSDKYNKRRIFIVISTTTGALLTYPFLALMSYQNAIMLSFFIGFFLLSGYPLLIASAEQIVAQENAAKAVAILQLMGNLGGVVVVVAMEVAKGVSGSWYHSIFVLIAFMAVAVPLSYRLKDIK